MKTRSIKSSELEEKWYVVDAKGVRLGKLAAEVSRILIGKDDVQQVAYHSPRNKVIILNTKSIDIHPSKRDSKEYFRHSGYVGGLKRETFDEVQKKRPNRVVRFAINGMLPKTKQRTNMLSNLYLYEDTEHKHEAQQPKVIKVN